MVKNKVNGLITNSKSDQTKEVARLVTEVFTDDALLRSIKEGALEESNSRWDENWMQTFSSIFENKS